MHDDPHDKKDAIPSIFSMSWNPLFDANGSINFSGNPKTALTIEFSGTITTDTLTSDVNDILDHYLDFCVALQLAGYNVNTTTMGQPFTYLVWGPNETIQLNDATVINVPLLLVGNPQTTGTTINVGQGQTANLSGPIYQVQDSTHMGSCTFNVKGTLTLNEACLLKADFNITGTLSLAQMQFQQQTYTINTVDGPQTYTSSSKDVTYNNGSGTTISNILHLYDSTFTLSGTLNSAGTMILLDYGSTLTLGDGAKVNGIVIAGWDQNTYRITGTFSIGNADHLMLTGTVEFKSGTGFSGPGDMVVYGDYYDSSGFHPSSVTVQSNTTLGDLYIGFDPYYGNGYGGNSGTLDPNKPTNSNARYGGTLTLYGAKNTTITLTGMLTVGGGGNGTDQQGTIFLKKDSDGDGIIFTITNPTAQGITVKQYGTLNSAGNNILNGLLDVDGGTAVLGEDDQIANLHCEGGTLSDSQALTVTNLNVSGGNVTLNDLTINSVNTSKNFGVDISGGVVTIGKFSNPGTSSWVLTVTGTGSLNITGASSGNSLYEVDISTSQNNSFTHLNVTTLNLNSGNQGNTELVSGSYTLMDVDAGSLTVDSGVTFSTIYLGKNTATGQTAGTIALNGSYSFDDLEAYIGTLTASGTITVKTLHQSGGNLTFNALTVTNADSNAFTLSGGTLTVNDLEYAGTLAISNTALVILKGGTLNGITLESNYTGTVTLNAGTLLTITDLEALAGTLISHNDQLSINLFHQSGGSLTFDTLTVTGTESNAFTVSGGTLTVNDLKYGGTLAISNAAMVTLNDGSLNEIDLQTGFTGTLTLKGGTYNTLLVEGGTLEVDGTIYVNSLNYTASNQSHIVINNGGEITYKGTQLNISTTGENPNNYIELIQGTLNFTQSNVTITGGYLSVGDLSNTNGSVKSTTLTLHNTTLTLDLGFYLNNANLIINGTGTVISDNLLVDYETLGQITLNGGINFIVDNITDSALRDNAPVFLLKTNSTLTFDHVFEFAFGKPSIEFDTNNDGAILRFGKAITETIYEEKIFSQNFEVSGFNVKDEIDLEGLKYSDYKNISVTYTNGKLTISLTDKNGKVHEIDFDAFDKNDSSLPSGTTFMTKDDGSGGILIFGCFLPGSLISTPSGYRAIETLSVGDELHNFTHNASDTDRIQWIGKTSHTVRPDLPADLAGVPVRIMKDAIAPNVPFEDLWITSEHCLCLDNQFIPARMLVNGYSIVYDRSFASYAYYHIETKSHSIINANGLLTESYLDTGNRKTFEECWGPALPDIHPVKTWDDAAAPLTTQRERVEPIFTALKRRAQQLGFEKQSIDPMLIEDPDLHLITNNGTIVMPDATDTERYTFTLPPKTNSIRIVSRSSRPCDTLQPFVDDRRYLGVLVGAITLITNGQSQTINYHLGQQTLFGWHEIENDRCRWTKGNAYLSLKECTSNSRAMLTLQILSKGPYLITPSENMKKTKQS